ncbi:hypothetical protein BBK36DRAFT_1083734, partial [Trichoderma citrinoviride]
STIPEQLVSLATIKYLGYNDDSAAKIWHDWTAPIPQGQPIPDTDPIFEMPFLDPIIGFSYGRKELDTWDEDDQKWFECMTRCGINAETQAAIMDPVFRDIRLTQTCLFWIRDTIETRWDALRMIQRAPMQREEEILGAARCSNGSPASQTIRSTPGTSEQHTALSEAALQNAPGSLTLYRGMSQARAENLFDEDGTVAIQRLVSRPPTDFCSDDSAYYFAVDRDVAIRDACWTRRRGNDTSVVIVHVEIPTACVERLSGSEVLRVYWPSEEWKRLIWICRNDHTFPSALVKYKRATLIIGTIAGKPNEVYMNMNTSSHQQITEKHVLKNQAGGDAVQYVFRNPEGRRLLAENAGFKVYNLPSGEY